MSVNQTFDDLYGIFSNPAQWTLVGPPTRVLEDPLESLNLADFPALVLAYDWTADHTISLHADTRSHHKFYIAIYVLLGAPSTSLQELHQRTRDPWPYQIFHILSQHITLGGHIEFLGDGEAEPFLHYRVGKFPWGSGGPNDWYWGYRFTILANEEGIENYQA